MCVRFREVRVKAYAEVLVHRHVKFLTSRLLTSNNREKRSGLEAWVGKKSLSTLVSSIEIANNNLIMPRLSINPSSNASRLGVLLRHLSTLCHEPCY